MADKADRWIGLLRQKNFEIENIAAFEATKKYAARRITQFANEDFIGQDLRPEEAAARTILGL